MSRIGKKPITIPAGVEVKLNGNDITVKGAKGELSYTFNADINVLSGKSIFGTFYLYKATDPEFIFEVNLSDGTYTHWHPDSKEEALQDVFDFMDNAIGWLCEELGIDI